MYLFCEVGEPGWTILFWHFVPNQLACDETGKSPLDASGKPIREVVRLSAPYVHR